MTTETAIRMYLTNQAYRESIFALAERLIDGPEDTKNEAESDPFRWQMATLLSESKTKLRQVATPRRLGIVFAMWNEARRLRPNSQANPHGEDCLSFKLYALDWLFSGSPMTWQLYAVDDDCPENSHDLAREIAAEAGYADRVTVLSLRKEFPFENEPLSLLSCVGDSTKGGAIVLGLTRAIKDGCEIVGYTDCDNSVNLGQLGLLLAPITIDGHKAAFGVLRPPKAATVVGLTGGSGVPGSGHIARPSIAWDPKRDVTSSKLLTHIRNLILATPLPLPLKDAPSPFKLFESAYLDEVLPRLRTFDFTFDTDLLMLMAKDEVNPVPVGHMYVDSFTESAWHTHGAHRVWYQKLKSVLRAARLYGLACNATIAKLIDDKISTEQDVLRILHLGSPPQLLDIGNASLGDPSIMSPDEVASWLDTMLPPVSLVGQRIRGA